jgi:hypothetical protein
MSRGFDVDARKRRWESFMRAGSPPGFMFIVRLGMPEAPTRPPLWPEFHRERMEWIWQDYEAHRARAEWLHDDLVPAFNMLTGTEIFAEALGCSVHRPTDNMPFALPLIHSTDEISLVRVPELSRSTLAYHFEMADELARRAGPGAVFRMVDVQSPMDIAALVMEKSAFYMAMLEAPEALQELADKAHRLLTNFLDEWFRRYGRGFVAHFPDYYMPAGITLSEDEIGAVNAETFDRLFLPHLNALSDRYGGIGIHCCANARHQWEGLMKVRGLRVLNICQPAPVVAEAYGVFSRHCVQMHANMATGPIPTWFAQYPKEARVVLEIGAQTREEAERVVGEFAEMRSALSRGADHIK